MEIGYYVLPAIRGRQGDYDYYLIQCPARLIARLVLFDEADVPAALRRGRTIDPTRVGEIAAYISNNDQAYTVAPLVAVVDGEISFEALADDLPEIGRLRISMAAHLVLSDGQHRRAAIQQVVEKNVAISENTIPIMLVPDPNLERSVRMYNQFNRYHLQPTLSKRVLLDHSDLAILVWQIVDETPLFQNWIELEKTTISNRSTALFTISAVYQATEALLGANKKSEISSDHVSTALQFWQELGVVIPEWKRVINREVTAAYVRQYYVHSHTVTLLAIGMAGHDLISAHPHDWNERLYALGNLDWLKQNTRLWEGRAMVRGKMSKTHDSVKLTAIVLKRALGLALSAREIELEQRIPFHEAPGELTN
jgi:DNA sulfur modification protein DndB